MRRSSGSTGRSSSSAHSTRSTRTARTSSKAIARPRTSRCSRVRRGSPGPSACRWKAWRSGLRTDLHAFHRQALGPGDPRLTLEHRDVLGRAIAFEDVRAVLVDLVECALDDERPVDPLDRRMEAKLLGLGYGLRQ